MISTGNARIAQLDIEPWYARVQIERTPADSLIFRLLFTRKDLLIARIAASPKAAVIAARHFAAAEAFLAATPEAEITSEKLSTRQA